MDVLSAFITRNRLPIAAAVALAFLPAPGDAQSAGEYDLKAAFLYNFAKFVDWPPSLDGAPFAICVAGADPFGPLLQDVARGRWIDGRPLIVRHPKRVEEAIACQVLFFGSMPRSQVGDWLAQLHNRPVLTVGDSPEFPQDGGIIAFRVIEQRVRFEINRTGAERAQLRLSSKLLSLAIKLTEASR